MTSGTATAGSWVTARVGVVLRAEGGAGAAGEEAPVALALRRNPRRAHLLVSEVLGKHVPVPGRRVLDVGERLGRLVAEALPGAGDSGPRPAPVVVGFAETATGLGHAVAAGLASSGAPPSVYLHTTRRAAPHAARVVRFAEEHSHAVDQSLAVADASSLATDAPLVLVDDEVTTGRTAVNAIRALHAVWPRESYVLATLLDTRPPEEVEQVAEAVAALGASVTTAALWRGRVHLPDDVLARAEALAQAHLPREGSPVRDDGGGPARATVASWVLELPAGVPVAAATGWSAADETGLVAAVAHAADGLRPLLVGRAHVLGDEEFMYAGQQLAAALGDTVTTSTTTRSPALVVDEPGYPLRSALRARATDGTDRPVVAYNVPASSDPGSPGAAQGFDTVVLVSDADLARAEVTSGLLARLAEAARRSVHAVQVVPGRAAGPVLRPACAP